MKTRTDAQGFGENMLLDANGIHANIWKWEREWTNKLGECIFSTDLH